MFVVDAGPRAAFGVDDAAGDGECDTLDIVAGGKRGVVETADDAENAVALPDSEVE